MQVCLRDLLEEMTGTPDTERHATRLREITIEAPHSISILPAPNRKWSSLPD